MLLSYILNGGKLMEYIEKTPELLKRFLTYMEVIKGRSQKTVEEYYLDIRMFFRFIKLKHKIVNEDTPIDEIDISDLDVNLMKSVSLEDCYDFLDYLAHERPKFRKSPSTTYGDIASTRARKVSSIRSFYKYITKNSEIANEFEKNPLENLEPPKIRKKEASYLSVDESIRLLNAVEGENKLRDYCILTIFLNCGLRVSELVGINLSDIHGDSLKVLGKGNKERTVYLNNACLNALEMYIPQRIVPLEQYKNALFISRNKKRINVQTVKWMVKKYILIAGLDTQKYSTHKLRHTAATLMYQNGVDVRTLRDVLGHERLDTTMIYTHICDQNIKDAVKQNPLADVTIDK